jgi:hypothetical protein
MPLRDLLPRGRGPPVFVRRQCNLEEINSVDFGREYSWKIPPRE